MQGDFDDTCKVVATMVNATGLHASEIVAISQKDIRPFETRILKVFWEASRLGRAKVMIFCVMCQRHRIAPSLLVSYGRTVWLARLFKTHVAQQSSQHKPYGKRISSHASRNCLDGR